MALFTAPRIEHGPSVTLEDAVMQLLPETGSVEVQRDTPRREHPTHTHPTDEILFIVKGSITFFAEGIEETCHSGGRLYLPKSTPHSSIAGDEGCLYIIALR
ncbi:cupin domain-containing protein [Marininema halotolerans]|uniref:Cupin domain-containing protein n=1 Tax=Marininema halotolerans TaxID=1155944 RepID=A0A1I6QNZ0_9BACL|nr:cupin domain-containing protein [Marininema halotolerans]SFS54176.1 Cupin domain-containing protein [Marininema halotolerans]